MYHLKPGAGRQVITGESLGENPEASAAGPPVPEPSGELRGDRPKGRNLREGAGPVRVGHTSSRPGSFRNAVCVHARHGGSSRKTNHEPAPCDARIQLTA